jgi:hypothetical protein
VDPYVIHYVIRAKVDLSKEFLALAFHRLHLLFIGNRATILALGNTLQVLYEALKCFVELGVFHRERLLPNINLRLELISHRHTPRRYLSNRLLNWGDLQSIDGFNAGRRV